MGEAEWARFTYAREPDSEDALQLLGSVRRGAQVGALAVTAEGAYLQVVGDYLAPLNKREIAKALAVAHSRKHCQPQWAAPRPSHAAAPAPAVVIVKRRRTYTPVAVGVPA